MSNTTRILVPVVGMAATVHHYSDSNACTVIAVSASGKTMTVRQDKATLLNGAGSGEPDALTFSPGGFCGHTEGTQRYTYEADPNGTEYKATLRTLKGKHHMDYNQVWVQVGCKTGSRGGSVTLGERHEFYDFNF